MRVIDAHVHLAPGSPSFAAWAELAGAEHTLPGLVAEMDAANVERAILIGHWVRSEGERSGAFSNRSNNDLLHFLDQGAGRFRGLLAANVTKDGVIDLEAIAAHLGRRDVVGVKFFTGYETFDAADRRLDPVFDLLEAHGKAAVFHTGDTLLPSGHLEYARPLAADALAVRRPGLSIVLAHAGQHWMADAGEVVGKNPNVWADISGWFIGGGLPTHVEFLKHQFQELVYWGTGCDRLMFGSDWPLMRIAPYIRFVQGCDFLTSDEKRAILYDNARRFYWGDVED